MQFTRMRQEMVQRQIASRGVTDERVLEAMKAVPRERFIPEHLHEFAYDDTALPIEAGQTISQPFMVALMAESLELSPEDRVLEVGAGSGYAAAVLGEIAAEVYAVERHGELVDLANERLSKLGCENVAVKQADDTLGWPEHAPYDAITVAAGGPRVAESLLNQLAIGGRLVMPVGATQRTQELVRVTRKSEDEFDRESLGAVQFVPLVGEEAWPADGRSPTRAQSRRRLPLRRRAESQPAAQLIRESCEPFDSIENADLGPLMDRIGEAKVVLIGEATHGTSEFYRMRARITQELIEEKGFDVVALEGDWPDVTMIDRHVRERSGPALREPAFSRFPTWMWRNEEVDEFVAWLRQHNETAQRELEKAGVYGLDLYSLYNSIGAVVKYLERVAPGAAEDAKVRYACFSPWETDPATYGRAATSGRFRMCAEEAVGVLTDLLQRRLELLQHDGEAFFDAERNATLIKHAERYYRAMYEGSRASWNLRDQHMFETLQSVLEHRGPNSKAVAWAHNSHIGDASATEMGARGETNIGQLARKAYGDRAYLIGFGTDHGETAAADNWGEPVRMKQVRPSHEESYERLFHDSGSPSFMLPLRRPARPALRRELMSARLERAIGVIYRPETELMSHYFQAVLPEQFDEYIWFDETRAITPLEAVRVADIPETYPFGV